VIVIGRGLYFWVASVVKLGEIIEGDVGSKARERERTYLVTCLLRSAESFAVQGLMIVSEGEMYCFVLYQTIPNKGSSQSKEQLEMYVHQKQKGRGRGSAYGSWAILD
jgi:hypothetical protein